MRAETEIVDQLSEYGAWLAHRPGVDLALGARSATDRALVEASLDDGNDVVLDLAAADRRPRWSGVLVAAAVLVVVAAGLLVASRRSSAPADQPPTTTDPPAALYVLPRDDRDVMYPSRDRGPLAPYTGIVVGTPDGDGYRDPVTVMAGLSEPAQIGGEWRPIELDTGPAIVADGLPLSARVAQQRGERWLIASAGAGESRRAADVLADVVLEADGDLSLEAGSADATITTFTNDLTGVGHSTYLELAGGVVVETATTADPLYLAFLADRVQAVTIDGRPAWHETDDRGAEGTWHALVWMGTPHRMIAVSGTVPYADVVEAAQRLEVVSEEEWEARTGADGN